MIVQDNTTIIDLSFNLTGSLTGVPHILNQLPIGERVGFDDIPSINEDVEDIGQTWTPSLKDVELDIDVNVYNNRALSKAPYTTNVYFMEIAYNFGNSVINNLITE